MKVTKADKEILKVQIDLLKQAINQLGTMVERLKVDGKNLVAPTQEDAEADAAIRIFQVRSLDLYVRTLTFIASEVRDSNMERHRFTFLHIRTLLDIYAHLAHLLKCSDENQRALTCLAYQTLTYARLGQELYEQGLRISRTLLTKQKISFPEKHNDFRYSWIQDNKLEFKKTKVLLDDKEVKAFSPAASEVFGAGQMGKIYGFLSDMLHGNPYYHTEPHNERFWIISMSIVISSFLLELVDKQILKRQSNDFRTWLATVKDSKTAFTDIWQNRRQAA